MCPHVAHHTASFGSVAPGARPVDGARGSSAEAFDRPSPTVSGPKQRISEGSGPRMSLDNDLVKIPGSKSRD